jgi:hypothetical protein
MDYYNNARGQQVASSLIGQSYDQIANKICQMLAAGELKVTDGFYLRTSSGYKCN